MRKQRQAPVLVLAAPAIVIFCLCYLVLSMPWWLSIVPAFLCMWAANLMYLWIVERPPSYEKLLEEAVTQARKSLLYIHRSIGQSIGDEETDAALNHLCLLSEDMLTYYREGDDALKNIDEYRDYCLDPLVNALRYSSTLLSRREQTSAASQGLTELKQAIATVEAKVQREHDMLQRTDVRHLRGSARAINIAMSDRERQRNAAGERDV